MTRKPAKRQKRKMKALVIRSLGAVQTVILSRNGQTFIHGFNPNNPPILTVGEGGVLVLSGGFTVDAKGFVHNRR